MSMQDETYLGDGLYASNDGYMIRLVADKYAATERSILIEPREWEELRLYAERVWPQESP